MRIDRIHVWKSLPQHGGKWIFNVLGDSVFGNFDKYKFVSEYPETIEEVNSLPPDLPFNFFKVLILFLFASPGDEDKIRKITDELGFYK